MNYRSTRRILTACVCAGILAGTASAQYRKMNFATNYTGASGSGVTGPGNAAGFHPTFSGSGFSGSATGLSASGSNTAYVQYSYGTAGSAGDTIYVKISSSNTTSQLSIQPYLGNAASGTGGAATDITLPSVNNAALSEGKLIKYVAKSTFDGVRITLAGGGSVLGIPFTNSASIYETFFKGAGTQWPQDCDRPFESVHNVNGLTLGGFANPYDFIDYGSNYLSTYSSMQYVVGSRCGCIYTGNLFSVRRIGQ